MREDRLLERIRSWEDEPGRREREDVGRIIHSVLNHLQRILNTRRGNVAIAEDYGIPDFTDLPLTYRESVRDVETSLRQTIQKYEPRLSEVRVRFIDPGEEYVLTLRFHIVAKLATSEKKNQVFFETVIDTDGRVDVTS